MIRIPVSITQLKKIQEEYKRCKKEGEPFEVSFTCPYNSEYYTINALNGCTTLYEVFYKYKRNRNPYGWSIKERSLFLTDCRGAGYHTKVKDCEKFAKKREQEDNLKLTKLKIRTITDQTELVNLSPILIENEKFVKKHGSYCSNTPTDWRGEYLVVSVPVTDKNVEIGRD